MAKREEPGPSEITPQDAYLRRREFMRDAGLFALTASAVGGSLLALTGGVRSTPRASPQAKNVPSLPPFTNNARYRLDEALTPREDVTH